LKRDSVKNPTRVLSTNRKVREMVDLRGKYRRWRLRIMGSCHSLFANDWAALYSQQDMSLAR